MHSVDLQNNPCPLLWAGTAVLALWALVSPAFGPVMDHHFAERYHNHSHIYIGLPDVDHIHTYQDNHSHRLASRRDDSNPPSGSSLPTDTVFLTPLDVMGQDAQAPLTPAAQPMNPFLFQGDSSVLEAWPQNDGPLKEAYIPPLKRPPPT